MRFASFTTYRPAGRLKARKASAFDAGAPKSTR
jgi:hypothetical protein